MPPKRQRLEKAHKATPGPTHGRTATRPLDRPARGEPAPAPVALASSPGAPGPSGPQAAPVDAALPSTSGCPRRGRTATPLPTRGRVALRRPFGRLGAEYFSPVPAALTRGTPAVRGLRDRQAAPADVGEASTTGDLSSPSTDSSSTASTSWGTTWADVETLRSASGEADDVDDPEGTLLWSVGSGDVVTDALPVFPAPPSPPALVGPFNSTMVEGGVPITDMPPPTMPLGPASTVETVRLAGGPEPPPLEEDDATPSQLVFPDEVPPCPLGLMWEMQLEQMRKAGVTCSWELPP